MNENRLPDYLQHMRQAADGVWQTLVAHALTLVDERFPGAAAANRFLMQLPA